MKDVVVKYKDQKEEDDEKEVRWKEIELEKEEEEMIYLISCTNGTPNYLSFKNLTFRLAAV